MHEEECRLEVYQMFRYLVWFLTAMKRGITKTEEILVESIVVVNGCTVTPTRKERNAGGATLQSSQPSSLPHIHRQFGMCVPVFPCDSLLYSNLI